MNNELINDVDQKYATNDHNVLVGHSYGGYFGSYILPMAHKFSAFQIYDPSIWYSDGEVIKNIVEKLPADYKTDFFISYQLDPDFHASKIEDLIEVMGAYPNIKLVSKAYPEETHESLYVYSFLEGIKSLYTKSEDDLAE